MLDATKAFDSLEWSYHFPLPQRIGLSPRFLWPIALLYAQPVASIRVNEEVSRPFAIGRGTRQG